MYYADKTLFEYKWSLFLGALKEDQKLGIHITVLVFLVNKRQFKNMKKEY